MRSNWLNRDPLGDEAVIYDANGNVTMYYDSSFLNGYNFYYDAENRLTEADDVVGGQFEGKVFCQYDGLGRLRVRTTYDYFDGVTNVVEYIYDGMRVIQERDGNNVPQVSYTRGSDLSGTLDSSSPSDGYDATRGAGGIGGLLARSAGYSSGNWTSHAYYHADGNGNIMYLETSSQGLGASYRYDPYGNFLGSTGSLAYANVYQFSSKELVPIDPTGTQPFETLYYYGYRFYAPNLQRWLNRDPLGELGFETLHLADQPLSIRKLLLGIYDPQMSFRGSLNSEGIGGPNLYEMTGNDGVNYVDPDGRGVWGGFKNGVLSPIGHFLGNNWGKLSAAVSTVCLVGPAYNCAQLWKAAANAADAYRNEVNQLNAKYGDPGDWPPDIQQLMSQWQSSIIQEAGQAAAACGGVGGTSITGGPIGGPEHPF